MANVHAGMPRSLLALCLVAACHRSDAVPSPTPTPMPTPAVAPAPDAAVAPVAFELVISEFHFETDTQFVRIDSAGHVDDVMAAFEEIDVKKRCRTPTAADKELCKSLRGEKTFLHKSWRYAQYDATAAEIDDLRKRLATANLPSLDKKYTGDNGYDGVTTTYRLTTGGATTVVSAYGTSTRGEPPPLLDVFRWMRATQDAHADARKAAPPMDDAQYKALALAAGISKS